MSIIYINGRFLSNPMTGINRFAYELCKASSRLFEFTIIAPNGRILPEYDIRGLNIIEYGRLKSHLWEQISLPLFLSTKKNYILLNFSGLGPLLNKSKITTIHDVSFLHNPDWFSKGYYLFYKILTPLIIKTSRAILTVSEFSKSEILKYYDVTPAKIHVVYNAVTKALENSTSDNQKDKYILTVGSLDPRKNFKTLIRAFSDERLKHLELRIVGGTNRVFGELGYDMQNSPNIKFLGRISDEELRNQYRNAHLFILASLYEGFGIPPLEALGNGCPIALSDIPVFHEIFEDAAVYFNPTDVNDIIGAILKSYNNSMSPSVDTPNKVLKKFSWNRSAKKIQSILNTI